VLATYTYITTYTVYGYMYNTWVHIYRETDSKQKITFGIQSGTKRVNPSKSQYRSFLTITVHLLHIL
jgi:hypothetical protein